MNIVDLLSIEKVNDHAHRSRLPSHDPNAIDHVTGTEADREKMREG